MRTIRLVTSKGNGIVYREVESGTCFHQGTPEAIVDRLEDARINRYRIRLFLGDPKTGRDWGEENDVIGYVARSTGTIKIPLLIHNSRSMGGGAILDECIIKIMVGRRTVYQAPGYQCGKYEIKREDDQGAFNKGYLWKVLRDGETTARFKTNAAAERWAKFMKGERHTKGGR